MSSIIQATIKTNVMFDANKSVRRARRIRLSLCCIVKIKFNKVHRVLLTLN